MPFLVSEKSGDGVAVGRASAHGAFDMIRYSLRGRDAADIIKRAFWLYELRLTIHNRKQRLDEFRFRHATTMMNTTQAAANLVERTIQKIQEADLVCERTIQQIETSVRVLAQLCLQAESEARDCAMRVARLL